MNRTKLFIGLMLLVCLAGCPSQNQPYDSNTEVPKGDPTFPPFADSWVIDQAGILKPETIASSNQIADKLQRDKIAEVAVVIINGVKHPEDWATHFGRYIKLGAKGLSTQGGNNGIVLLIRPDAQDKLTISVGRGLPKFTAIDYGMIMDEVIDYFNFQNYDQGVKVILEKTDKVLRQIKKSRKS